MVRLGGRTGCAASQQPATVGFRELISELEQPMMGSGDGREAGGCSVGGLVEWGGRDACLLARKWG